MKETESVASRLLNTMGVSIKKIYTELLEGMGEDVSRLKAVSYTHLYLTRT